MSIFVNKKKNYFKNIIRFELKYHKTKINKFYLVLMVLFNKKINQLIKVIGSPETCKRQSEMRPIFIFSDEKKIFPPFLNFSFVFLKITKRKGLALTFP